ncbi:GNAT family N-acetyltransferase [Enterovirga rhinocerotis]|uniref:N-acetylglutamate synthase-like GNAT family acetyltransferase n=1 Tax=Enterovirga rhinocerotis TaxID=1339210 RepID=A0A4R7BMW2_9HYPH|nr:GNAT family N-acetyltransferase [Enterovirga rhinocerotis]TDR85246.1 N-acetylglutamate synthase-like GNAT family acetyltransferase [Enterovirga rhinocerotis]
MADVVVQSSPLEVAAQPLLEALVLEYDGRYGALSRPGGARSEILRYPAEAYRPPLGDFLLLLRDGETVGGGAFMSHDDDTVELKRIWTRADLRRQGLARRIVQALEDSAARLGYTRAYLTTGFRQPEATALYVSLGYRRLFDASVDPALYRSLPFEKLIGTREGEEGDSHVHAPAASFEEATARVTALKAEQERRVIARLSGHSATAA